MIIEIAFIVTVAVLIMVFVRITSIVLPGADVTLPYIIPGTGIGPDTGIILYPSMMFQIWFWAERLGVF